MMHLCIMLYTYWTLLGSSLSAWMHICWTETLVSRLLLEFPATGGIITSTTFYTVKLLRYVTTLDYVVLGCEIVVFVFVIYYIMEEVMEVRRISGYHEITLFQSRIWLLHFHRVSILGYWRGWNCAQSSDCFRLCKRGCWKRTWSHKDLTLENWYDCG